MPDAIIAFLCTGSSQRRARRWLVSWWGLTLALAQMAAAPVRQSIVSAAVPGSYAFKYLLYLPPGYDPNNATARWPLMIFLHGSNQSGSDIDLVSAAGPTRLIEQGRDFPCVVVSPQAPFMFWDPVALDAFIQDRMAEYRIDADRVYVTGLSMGGYGTWALAERSPGKYAAAMPLCGGGDPQQAAKLRDLPLWAFHGALDTTVPLIRTQEMIDGVQRAGGNPKLTIYPDLGHDVWTVTYANDAVYSWLFAQNRVRSPAPPLIGTQPLTLTSTSGLTITFSIAAGGVPAPAYQWQRLAAGAGFWENLSEGGGYRGVTTTTLTAGPISAAMSGDQFRCVLTNPSGSATSASASLSVSAGSQATLQYPAGVALDTAGSLYVADAVSNTIRKITPSGSVSTLAGVAGSAGSTDGTGASARFNQPGAVAVDSAGNVYVADTGNSTIRKITPAGVVTTLAGSAASRGSTDGTGNSASFNSPGGIAVDTGGNVYVADTMNATIRRISSAGLVSTLAGQGGQRGDIDGAGGAARFNSPSGLALDAAGNLYVADTYNDTIRKIAPNGIVTTLAGSPGISGATDLTGPYALFNQPGGVAVDTGGNLYVADAGNATIRQIESNGAVVTIAGTPGVAGIVNGTGGSALFNQPHALVLDNAGTIFVADTGNAAIRKITAGRIVTTLTLTETAVPAPATTAPTATTPVPTSVAPAGTTSPGGGGGSVGPLFSGILATLFLLRRRLSRDRLSIMDTHFRSSSKTTGTP